MNEIFDEIALTSLPMRILSTVTGGFLPKGKIVPIILRICFLILFILIFLVVDAKRWNLISYIIFSGAVAVFVLAAQITLFILNKLVGVSFEVSSSSGDEPNEKAPEGISDSLWRQRGNFKYDEENINQTVNNLMDGGFTPDEVFKLVEAIKSGRYSTSPTNNNLNKYSTSEHFIQCCGMLVKMNLSKREVIAIFPEKNDIVYIILSSLMAFISNFCISYAAKYTGGVKYYAMIFGGISTYSILQCPDIETYSIVIGNPYNGITRPFFMTLLFGIQILLHQMIQWCGDTSYIKEFEVTFYWKSIAAVYDEATIYACGLIWIWFFGFVGPADHTLTWLLEWVGRYLFGLGGFANLPEGILQIIRSGAVIAAMWAVEKYLTFKYKIGAYICVGSFLLQIPFNVRNTSIITFLKVIAESAAYSLLLFASSVIFIEYDVNKKVTEIVCITIICVINIAIPAAKVYTRYIIATFRLLQSYEWMNYVKIIISNISTIITITYFIINSQKDGDEPWLTSLLAVMLINRGLSDPVSFSYGLLGYVLIHYEIQMLTTAPGLILGMAIGKKMLSLIDIVFLGRMGRSCISGLLGEDDSLFLKVVMPILMPFPDRCVSTTSLFWSVITGAPMFAPAGISAFLYPMAVRPNAFWSVFQETRLDIIEIIERHATTYVQEAPIYTSLVRTLIGRLGSLVHSGELGLVSENDLFIFVGESIAAFVHIVGLEDRTVRFQVRGLEYQDTTACHAGEIGVMKDLRDAAEEVATQPLNSLPLALDQMMKMWSIVTDGVSLHMYDLVTTVLGQIIASSSRGAVLHYAEWAAAYALWRGGGVPAAPSDAYAEAIPHVGHCFAALSGSDVGDEQERALRAFATAFAAAMESEETLLAAFQGVPSLPEEVGWVSDSEGLVERIVVAARVYVLLLYLANASLIGEPGDDEEMTDFLASWEEAYYVGPAHGSEFSEEFNRGQKRMICLEEANRQRKIINMTVTKTNWDIFKVNTAQARSMWASEALTQNFFKVTEPERLSIQQNTEHIHNLLVQACDLPIGYPALVSPICESCVTIF